MANKNITLKLFDKQRTAWHDILDNDDIRRILFYGGARSGKTEVILAWLVAQAMMYPGMRILVLRLRQDHAVTTLFNLSLKRILPPGTCGVVYNSRPPEVRFPNGSLIRVSGLDDAARVSKIQGDEYTHIYINEATEVSWEAITVALTRLSQNIDGTVRKLIMDCNPVGTEHWLHYIAMRHLLPGRGAGKGENKPLPDANLWATMHWVPTDNPYLPQDTIDTLNALPGIQRRRRFLGEWCNNEGVVYEDFDPSIHVIDDLPPDATRWRRIRSLDFGFTNPAVCLWGAVDSDGRLYVYDELYKAGLTAEDLADAVLSRGWEGSRIIADPEDASARATLRRKGIETEAANKAVTAGIQSVQQRLRLQDDAMPRLFITKQCYQVLQEMASYRWEVSREGVVGTSEKPHKANDHAMDALRYMVMALDTPPPVYAATSAADVRKELNLQRVVSSDAGDYGVGSRGFTDIY